MDDLIIVGAGFAGLACAQSAVRRGLRTWVLERKPAVGTRVHTTGLLVKEAAEDWDARFVLRARSTACAVRALACTRGPRSPGTTSWPPIPQRCCAGSRARPSAPGRSSLPGARSRARSGSKLESSLRTAGCALATWQARMAPAHRLRANFNSTSTASSWSESKSSCRTSWRG